MIKQLTTDPILQPFCPDREIELHTDASALGLGAMLMQRSSNGKLHLVYAISRRTSDPERNYHSSKLELNAIVWAVTRLRNWLINIPFKIVTDCSALLYLNTHKTKNPQIVRWSLALSEFNYEIVHRPGVKMCHVDALSRAPVEPPDLEEECCDNVLGIFSIVTPDDEITLFQCADEFLRSKREILLKPVIERTIHERNEVTGYELKNSILYKRENNKLLYVVPKSLRKSIVIRHHDLRSHAGLDRTVSNIRELYFFAGMKSYVRQHIRSCIQCIICKSKTGKPAGELHPIKPGERPFALIHVDHIGPLITATHQNKFILVITDTLTKFVILTATTNTKAINVVKAFENFILDFGVPRKIISDRGTCFTSKIFSEFCERHGIEHSLNSPRHPQANGLVERVNRTLIPAIQACVSKPDAKDWVIQLKKVQRNLNSSPNKATGKTPFELLYGYINCHDEGLLQLLVTRIHSNYKMKQE